jgi:hypothetical protein
MVVVWFGKGQFLPGVMLHIIPVARQTVLQDAVFRNPHALF